MIYFNSVSIYLLVIVSVCQRNLYTAGYSWYIKTSFASSACANPDNGVTGLLMLQTKKCYQTSSSTSSMALCSNTVDSSGNIVSIKRNIIRWPTNNCGGTPSLNGTNDISVSCVGGVKFSCVDDPPQDLWPGIGIWAPQADDGKGQDCATVAGPQFVQTVPPFCNNDGVKSWKMHDAENRLFLTYYASIDCSKTTVITASELSYRLNECIDYVNTVGDGNIYRGYASLSIASIPGTGQLTIPADITMGTVTDATMSMGAVIGIVLAVGVTVIFFCLMAYYLSLHYNFCDKQRSNVMKMQNEENAKKKGKAGGEDDAWDEFKVNFSVTDLCQSAFLCSCCYEEFD
jgi:hypothetical protein